MPLAVYLLGLCIFAQGTSEFLLGGLLPDVASDLRITLPVAGTLISAFAVGMVVGAPVLGVLTLRWSRVRALLAFQAVFVVSHAVSALAPGFGLLVASRVVAAVAYAGFWAVASATVVGLVPADRTARALAVVAGGVSLATVLGVPAGTMLGQIAGWRAAFWAVAALTTAGAVALALVLPPERDGDGPVREPRRELRVLRHPRLWLAYLNTALTMGTFIVTFSYLGALLADTTRIAPAWVPGVLALFGVGGAAGLAIGGRTADRHPHATLAAATGGVLVVSVLLAVASEHPVPTTVLVALLGLTGLATNPALNQRVYALGAEAPTMAGAANVSAFNVGITVAPLLGGLTIGAGFGLPSVGWVGAAFAVAALLTTALDARLERRATRGRRAAQAGVAPADACCS